MIESFVINLDREPHRYAAFENWNRRLGIQIKRFPAVDGALLDDRARRAIATSTRVTTGGIGNAASHKLLWEHCEKQGRRIVVLEDDAVLRSDFKAALETLLRSIKGFWDIVLLGWNTDSVLAFPPGENIRRPTLPVAPTETELTMFQLWTAPPSAARLTNAFGTCGYLINPRGASRLLKECFPITDRTLMPVGVANMLIDVSGIDGMMNTIYPSMNAFASCPPLVMTPNDRKTSTTR